MGVKKTLMLHEGRKCLGDLGTTRGRSASSHDDDGGILYLTGLNNVNLEQMEAGRLDGAKGFAMLWNVVLPQLRPAMFIAGLTLGATKG